VPDKENAQHFTGTKKCGGEKIPQRRLRRLGFFGAQNARIGHFAVTVCYMPCPYFTVFFYFYHIPYLLNFPNQE
jgi:hypothetical protein